ncbi:MAG: hypothetical protein ACRD29_04705 [Acidimicrobiales bacterium]
MAEYDKALLWAAVSDIDLQVYKASVYKLRWATPGVGLDMGVPALEQARLTLTQLVSWPAEVEGSVADLETSLATYIETLEARDHTTASGLQTQLFAAVERLRDEIRKL